MAIREWLEVSYRVDLIVCLLSAAAVRLVAHGVREHDSKGQEDLSRCHAQTKTQALSSREACRMNDRCAYRVGDGTFVAGTSTDIEADARQDFRSERTSFVCIFDNDTKLLLSLHNTCAKKLSRGYNASLLSLSTLSSDQALRESQGSFRSFVTGRRKSLLQN